MPGVSRVTTDTAGGQITGLQVPTVLVNGQPIVVKGDKVAPHGPGAHASAVMVGCSSTVFGGGIAVCRAGDQASCLDVATGSANVFAG